MNDNEPVLRRTLAARLALTRLLALLLACLASTGWAEVDDTRRKVEASLLAEAAGGQPCACVVLLAEQADLSAAYSMRDADARGWYVYNTLRAHARRTQAGLRTFLRRRGVESRSLWAANAVVTNADQALLAELAARADVRRIESNRPARWIEDPPVRELVYAPDAVDTVEWGVSNVNAPLVWALGFTGQGIVIGNEDTGMQWNHPAIKPHYRGWNGVSADHNYNWHDAIHSGGGVCGTDSAFPCDDNGHGTFTTGIATGDDGGTNQIGVAPGAQWIGCRNMDQGNGTPATYTECFQFFIAPTDLNGNNADPTRRPHVINNSWGCPPSEGCAANTLQTVVENTRAAGIFVEASAGNSGPNCSTVDTPASIYAASFTTGAYDINNTLASFSSRGPVTVDMSNRLKPDIAAPGVNVRSSFPTNTYGSASGTSAAGPHVVGVVALLWSARPQLARDIDATESVLRSTANPAVTVSPAQTCAGISSITIPNNTFGYGRVDALAAINAVPILTLTPTDTPTRTMTPTASVSPTTTATQTRTITTSPTRTATDTPTRTPTATLSSSATFTSTTTATPTLSLTATPTVTSTAVHSLSGRIGYYSGDRPVAGATVQLSGDAPQSMATDTAGTFAFEVADGNWMIQPAKTGELNGAVTALDAVYILQSTVHLRTLTPLQQLACDATGNGSITALDAVRILQLQVGLITRLPVASACDSDWAFVPMPSVSIPGAQLIAPQIAGESCQRGAIAIPSLTTSATGQDFVGVLFGDCTGNWTPAASPSTTVRAAAASTVSALRAGHLQRGRGGRLRLPLYVRPGNAFHALDLELAYDAARLHVSGARAADATDDSLVQFNADVPGELRIALAGARLRAGSAAPTLLVDFEPRGPRAASTTVRLRGATLYRQPAP